MPLRSGWNWTPSSAAARDRRDERPAVVGRRRATTSSSSAGGHAGVRVDEVEVGAVGDAVEQRVIARPLDLVPADVGQGRRVLEPDASGPARTPRVSAPSSSLPSNSSCRPRQMPRNGRSAASQARIGSTRPAPVEALHRGRGRADARHDERVRAVERLGVATIATVGADG